MSTAYHNRYRRATTPVECKALEQSDIQNSNPSDRDLSNSKLPSRPLQSSTLPPLSTSTNLPQKPTLEPKLPRVPDVSILQPTAQSSPLSLYNAHRSSLLPTLTDVVSMSLSGVSFSYDLGAIKSDPHEVIELLKVTSSERGNWIHVAAYYRRHANPRAAIAVITAMLEVMVQQKTPETELKPAYLLLSGCETDLAKQARNEKKDSTEHYKNAQTWLQKVYGTFDNNLRIGLGSTGAPPNPKAASSSSLVQSKSRPTSSTNAPTEAPPLPPPPSAPAHSYGHDRILQREIQSLRDRLDHQRNLLADVRSSKRKLEEDLELERNYRRRLERHIDDLREERDAARDYGHCYY
ncbi:hypothetical protein PQX77_012480 [Marasmius sp. AFHP31]|nr:hypothetical protein PQX77_012480 [Marasmius sp. AFHP31]